MSPGWMWTCITVAAVGFVAAVVYWLCTDRDETADGRLDTRTVYEQLRAQNAQRQADIRFLVSVLLTPPDVDPSASGSAPPRQPGIEADQTVRLGPPQVSAAAVAKARRRRGSHWGRRP